MAPAKGKSTFVGFRVALSGCFLHEREHGHPEKGHCWRPSGTFRATGGAAHFPTRALAEEASKRACDEMAPGSTPYAPEHLEIASVFLDTQGSSVLPRSSEEERVTLQRSYHPIHPASKALRRAVAGPELQALLKRLKKRASATRGLSEAATLSDLARTMLVGKQQGLSLAVEIVESAQLALEEGDGGAST